MVQVRKKHLASASSYQDHFQSQPFYSNHNSAVRRAISYQKIHKLKFAPSNSLFYRFVFGHGHLLYKLTGRSKKALSLWQTWFRKLINPESYGKTTDQMWQCLMSDSHFPFHTWDLKQVTRATSLNNRRRYFKTAVFNRPKPHNNEQFIFILTDNKMIYGWKIQFSLKTSLISAGLIELLGQHLSTACHLMKRSQNWWGPPISHK